MKTTVEDRIVQLRFDNDQFEKGAEQSLRTLDKLEGVLDTLGNGSLDKLGGALDAIQYRFSTLGMMGAAAIENITGSVMRLASSLLTAIPNQIISGGKTRALNIEQARFQLKGLGVAWDDVADDIDHAVKGTAYGLDEAAIVASQLAASGVNYKNLEGQISDMGKILRGISGVAAMTNSSYGEIGHIFTGIAGTGHVMTQDLRMLEGRGLNVAAKLAQVLNETTNSAQYTEESIRDMVSKGQVDFLTFARAMDYAFGEHATAANETYTGSLSNMKAALSRIGADFATPTFTALRDIQNALRVTFDNVRKITKPFAEGTYTKWLNDTVPKVINLINKVSDGIVNIKTFGESIYNSLFNPIRKIYELGEHGGITEVIVKNDDVLRRLKNIRDFLDGIRVIFLNVKDVIDTAKISLKHFMEDFGLKGFSSGLDGILDTLGNFGRKLKETGRIFKWLKKSSDSEFSKDKGWVYSIKQGGFIAEDAKERFLALRQVFYDMFTMFHRVGNSAFRILKAGFDIVKTVFKDLAGVVKVIFPSFGSFSDTFRSLTDFIGKASEKMADFVERIRDLVQSHQILTGIATVISTVAEAIRGAIKWTDDFIRQLFGLEEGETIFTRFGDTISRVGELIRNAFDNIKESVLGALGTGKSDVGSILTTTIGGLLTGLMAYRKFEKTKWKIQRSKRTWDFLTKGQFDLAHDLANLPDKIATVLSRTSTALRGFTDNLDAKTLKEIGKAILFLAAGMWIMASVDADRMIVALAGVATVLLLLIGVMGVLITFMDRGSSAFTKVTRTITQQTTRWGKFKDGVKNLGTTLKNFFRGLTVGINRLLSAGSIFLLSTSLVALAGAVILLAIAAKIFATMNWEDLKKGLVSIIVTLGLLVGAIYVISQYGGMGIGLLGIAASLVALGIAIALLTASLYALSKIDFDTLVHTLLIVVLGIAMMVSALLVLTSFSAVAGAGMILAATAMLIFSVAILVLTAALIALSYIPWDYLLVDLALLALGLLAFGGILMLMGTVGAGVLAAAAAMLILSVAIIAISAALIVLSQFDPKKLALTAAVIALTFVALAGVLLLLSAAAPEAMIAAAALFVVGLAFMALGAGVLLGSVGLIALATALQLMPSSEKIMDVAKGLKKLSGAMIRLGFGGMLSSLGTKAFEALVPLATALAMMENLDFAALVPGLKGIGAALSMLGLGGVMLFLGGIGLKGAALALTALATALPELAKGFKAFEGIDADTIAYAGIALGKAVGSLFTLQFSTFKDGVPTLIELSKALPNLARGFNAFSGIDPEWIKNTGNGLSKAIGGIFKLQFATFRDGVPVLVELSRALPGLASGFNSFSRTDPEWIANTGDGLSKAIGALFKLQFSTFRDGVPVLVELSKALPGLAAGFNAFSGTDPDWIANTGNALSIGVGSLFKLQFSTFKDGVPVLVELSNALPGLASGFSTFSGMDPDMIANTGVALGKAIGALFKLQFSSFIDGTQSLVSLGNSLPTLAEGFKAFEGMDPEWIRNTASALSDGINTLTGNILGDLFKGNPDFEGKATGIMQIATAVAAIPEDGGDRLIDLGTGLLSLDTIAADILESIPLTLQTIYDTVVLYSMMTTTEVQLECDTILQTLRDFDAAMSDILNGMLNNLSTVASQAYTYGANIGQNLANGLWSMVGEVQAAANALYAAASAYEAAESRMSRSSFGYQGMGTNFTALYAQTGRSVGESFGNGVASGVSSSLGIHSPSRVFEQFGKYTAMGFANGLTDGGPDVANGFTNIMNPLYAALSDIMSEDFDVSPTITPVVDMSNVSEMFGAMYDYNPAYAASAAGRVASSQRAYAETATSNAAGLQQTPVSGGITVNVYPSAGMDESALADKVYYKIREAEHRTRVAKG